MNSLPHNNFNLQNTIFNRNRTNPQNIQPYKYYTQQHHVRKLLKNEIQKIGKKMNKVAVNWLQIQCILRNINLETNILAVILYYCFIRIRKIQKQQLQPILITCIYLANKFYNGPIVNLSQALDLVHKSHPVQKILKLQHEILQTLDFNLIIPNNMPQIIIKYQKQPQLCNKFCFYIEILLLNDHSILFSQNKIKELEYMEKQNVNSANIFKEICESLRLSQVEIIINKYRGKFNVDQLLTKFIK